MGQVFRGQTTRSSLWPGPPQGLLRQHCGPPMLAPGPTAVAVLGPEGSRVTRALWGVHLPGQDRDGWLTPLGFQAPPHRPDTGRTKANGLKQRPIETLVSACRASPARRLTFHKHSDPRHRAHQLGLKPYLPGGPVIFGSGGPPFFPHEDGNTTDLRGDAGSFGGAWHMVRAQHISQRFKV